MKLISSLAIAITLIQSCSVRAGEFCGSKEGYLNQIAAEFIIPDYFPPETEILRGLISTSDYERCASISLVNLGDACRDHDNCYTVMMPKPQCDRDLQDAWIKTCRSTYYKLTLDSQACRLACETFVRLMSEAQRYDSNGICPSCEAYNSTKEILE